MSDHVLYLGWRRAFALFSTACFLAVGFHSASAAVDNSDCMACHSDEKLTKKDASGKTVSLFVPEAKFSASVHGKQKCTGCHADITEVPHPDRFKAKPAACSSCHESQSATYGASVHGLARAAGKSAAAGCKDCHGSHEMLAVASAKSSVNRLRLAATCGVCHAEASREVQRSVHGTALAKGVREAPTCTDCHSEHKIEPLKTASAMKISGEVCSACHSSERMATKYHLPADRVKTFFASYHGLAARLGSTRAANCASCHGWHAVLPSSDPQSPIHKNNLATTCGHCHPDIGIKLASGPISIHAMPGADDGKHWIVNLVARFYIVLILVVIGAMLAHNGLDFVAKVREHILWAAQVDGEMRMTVAVRVQHFTLIVLFFLLAYTGFVHKYPEAVWSWPFHLMPNGNYLRGMIHRVAGWIFTGLLGVHCFALLGTRVGRAELRALWPRLRDWQDLWATVAFNFGLRKTRPSRERFNYVEKSEYWALLWGSVVMIITGITLIFTEAVLRLLPKVWLDVAQTIHYYEAVLATLAIVVWHFYAVLFDPHESPMNPVWLIGKKPSQQSDKTAERRNARKLSPPPPPPHTHKI